MVGNSHSQKLLYRSLNLLNPWITEFKHSSIFNIDEMIVLLKLEGTLKLTAIVTKLMLGNKVTVLKKLDSVV
mgnify:CR=1 FL=1